MIILMWTVDHVCRASHTLKTVEEEQEEEEEEEEKEKEKEEDEVEMDEET